MTILITLAIAVLLTAGLLAWVKHRLDSLPIPEKKALVKQTVNDIFIWFEEKGLAKRNPAFDRSYLQTYPSLAALEKNYADVRDECLKLLEIKDQLVDISALGGSYTQAGIHTARWKSFMFKSGTFVEENCARAPKTAALLRKIPGLYTAFFSILDPHQKIPPHWGYYRGFVRYHLGVWIPGDNEDHSCYLRVNGDPAENALRDPKFIENGETYYWKNGEGIVFDDNYLHDAENGSNEVRVVLWLDLRRKMPFYLQPFNLLCLWVAHRDESVRKIRRNAVVVD